MAAGDTRIADIVVPEVFSGYTQQLTTEKSAFVASGAMTLDPQMSANLAGGGLTFNSPSFKDLDNDADNIGSDDPAVDSTPVKTGTSTEIQVRLTRNQSWSTMHLASELAGADPAESIAQRVSSYWMRRLQAATIATVTGLFADNAAAPAGSEHVQNDMTHDISGVFSDGVTNFSTAALIDAAATMGDSADDLALMVVHAVVYARMRKNNLIDFIPDSENPAAARIATFQGQYRVIVDSAMPNSTGDFNTWLFGPGALRLGTGAPKVPTEIESKPSAGNGQGQEILYNRTQWLIHPAGNAYVGTAPNGGPTNAATANNLAAAGSWLRVFPERNQIKIARLITTEF